MSTPDLRLSRLNKASHELHREEMVRFGGELAWVQDPSAIPDRVVDTSGSLPEQCYDISSWMLERLGAWSGEGHSRLGLKEAFEKHELPNTERVQLRQGFQKTPAYAYAPGIVAMTEIFSVVPEVAVREGKGREDWAAIARQAGAFGTALAMDGTAVQALIRDYLKDEEKTFIRVSPKGLGDNPAFLASAWDARKLKLDDETGITTVTPYDDLRLAAIDIVEKHLVGENAHACVALQAPSPAAGCRNMFTAVWSAYGSAVERLIYSQADESAVQVTAQDEKDQYYEQHLLEILYDQMDRLSQMV